MTRDSVILYSQLIILYIRDSGNGALCRLRCDLCDRYEWWLRRGVERLLWLRLYQNKRHCFKERWQYYLRMSCNLHVQYIYLTHGQCTMYHTFHVKQARTQRGTGVPDTPPPLRFVKGGVLWRGLIGRRGGPTVVFTLLSFFFWLASLAIILQTVYILPSRMHLFSMEQSFFFIFPLSKLWNRSNLLSLALWFSYSFI